MIKEYYLENHKEIKILQDDELFLINTDTTVLGEFIEVYKKDTILDIGTNTGALLLYAALFNPKKIVGIDINEKALELAKQNLDNNKITNYELIHIDANNFKYKERFDVIICNPPYFKEKDKSNNEYKNLAKFDTTLKLDNLITTIDNNIKNYGTIYLLYLSSRLDEVILELEKHKIHVKELKFVFDGNKQNSNVCLIKAKKGGVKGMVVTKPVIIKR